MERKFKVLMFGDQFVDESKLADGIYTKAVPTLHNEKANIEDRIAIGQKMVDTLGGHPLASGMFRQEWQDAHAANIRKCAFRTVTVIVD